MKMIAEERGGTDGLKMKKTTAPRIIVHVPHSSIIIPEICLGTDPVFTPAALRQTAEEYFVRAGLNVSVNAPFAGTMVPEPFYSAKDTRVESLMIEVKRSLYMDEKSGRKKETFAEVKECVQGCLELLGSRAWQRTDCGNT